MRSNLVWSGLSLVIGLWIGQLFAASPAPTAAAPASPVPLVAVARQLSRADVAAAVRDELARALPAEQPTATPSVATAPAEPGDDGERASQVVGAALSRGVWTDADKDALGEALEGIPGHRKAEVTAQLADAVNRGVVSLDVEGFPL